MAVKKIKVRIYHTFEVDIPEDLMGDVEEGSFALDEFLYENFIDSDWYFSDLDIVDVN